MPFFSKYQQVLKTMLLEKVKIIACNILTKKRDTPFDASLLKPAKPFMFGFRPFP
jgi:hypothetical protein